MYLFTLILVLLVTITVWFLYKCSPGLLPSLLVVGGLDRDSVWREMGELSGDGVWWVVGVSGEDGVKVPSSIKEIRSVWYSVMAIGLSLTCHHVHLHVVLHYHYSRLCHHPCLHHHYHCLYQKIKASDCVVCIIISAYHHYFTHHHLALPDLTHQNPDGSQSVLPGLLCCWGWHLWHYHCLLMSFWTWKPLAHTLTDHNNGYKQTLNNSNALGGCLSAVIAPIVPAVHVVVVGVVSRLGKSEV